MFMSSSAGALAEEDGQRRGAGKRSRGGAIGYSGASMRARSAGGVVGRAHKEATDPLREAAAQEEEDLQAIQGAQRDGRIVQLAITCVGVPCCSVWVAAYNDAGGAQSHGLLSTFDLSRLTCR